MFQKTVKSELFLTKITKYYNIFFSLIARMLVRNPEKRATLTEIANHKWLKVGKQDNPPIDTLPLVSREQLSEEDHNVIVQKIVNGNIATKEEIQE